MRPVGASALVVAVSGRVVVRIILVIRVSGRVSRASRRKRGGATVDGGGRTRPRRRIASLFIPLRMQRVILMEDAVVGAAVGTVLSALGEAGRAASTLRHHQAVLDRFVVFLAQRGLDRASEQVCIDFIEKQTGVRLASLGESVTNGDVQAVRRPVALLTQALAGRPVEVARPVIPVHDGCPVRFRSLRDDYLATCRERGNVEATLLAKDKAFSRAGSRLLGAAVNPDSSPPGPSRSTPPAPLGHRRRISFPGSGLVRTRGTESTRRYPRPLVDHPPTARRSSGPDRSQRPASGLPCRRATARL